jgi:hypothetical protein
MSRLSCTLLGIGVLFLTLSAGAQTWDRKPVWSATV